MINTAKVEIRSNAILSELDCFGLNLIHQLRLAGAGQIISVNLNERAVQVSLTLK